MNNTFSNNPHTEAEDLSSKNQNTVQTSLHGFNVEIDRIFADFDDEVSKVLKKSPETVSFDTINNNPPKEVEDISFKGVDDIIHTDSAPHTPQEQYEEQLIDDEDEYQAFDGQGFAPESFGYTQPDTDSPQNHHTEFDAEAFDNQGADEDGKDIEFSAESFGYDSADDKSLEEIIYNDSSDPFDAIILPKDDYDYQEIIPIHEDNYHEITIGGDSQEHSTEDSATPPAHSTPHTASSRTATHRVIDVDRYDVEIVPRSAQPTTVEPTTVEPTTVGDHTAESTTAEPTTVGDHTEAPTTAGQHTEESTTVEPTTVGQHTDEHHETAPTIEKSAMDESHTVGHNTAEAKTVEPTTNESHTVEQHTEEHHETAPTTVGQHTDEHHEIEQNIVEPKTDEHHEIEQNIVEPKTDEPTTDDSHTVEQHTEEQHIVEPATDEHHAEEAKIDEPAADGQRADDFEMIINESGDEIEEFAADDKAFEEAYNIDEKHNPSDILLNENFMPDDFVVEDSSRFSLLNDDDVLNEYLSRQTPIISDVEILDEEPEEETEQPYVGEFEELEEISIDDIVINDVLDEDDFVGIDDIVINDMTEPPMSSGITLDILQQLNNSIPTSSESSFTDLSVSEVRELMLAIDNLLEFLPDEKIEELSQKDFYHNYIKFLDDLGI